MKTKSKTNNKVRLPKKLKDRWVKALRSGKYKQATKILCKTDENETYSYCCLGVACKLQGIPESEMKYDDALPSDLDYDSKQAIHPFFLQNDLHGELDANDTIIMKLVNFNDQGRSFKWIASYIERYL